MDAYLSNNQNRGNSFDRPPILIAADSEAGEARALGTVTMAGFRVADSVSIEGARDRIDRQGAASALWIELDADAGAGAAIDGLLHHVSADVAQGHQDGDEIGHCFVDSDRLGCHAVVQ